MNDETLLEFPCDFPIKIMGRESPEFRALARSLVEKHTGPLADGAIQDSLSRNGAFVSVTITINAQSQQQLDDIYRAVTSNDDVLMAL
jgi:putative lipoic acid-binding regulatory protein